MRVRPGCANHVEYFSHEGLRTKDMENLDQVVYRLHCYAVQSRMIILFWF